MKEMWIRCRLITPMFSFGAYRESAELRTSELKGAMRYTYRIACPSDTKTLAKEEAELFGFGAGNLDGHASPIRLLIQGNKSTEQECLLLHKNCKKLSCFLNGVIKVRVCLNQNLLKKDNKVHSRIDLEWYGDLIKLSLLLCGMGRRSRKGRGCFDVDDLTFENKEQIQKWLCGTLNKVASAFSQEGLVEVYQMNGEEIVSAIQCSETRPVIQRILIGRRLDKWGIGGYLCSVDKACHALKKGDLKLQKKEITGTAGKLASPLLIRIVKAMDGYYPLYIFVKGVFREKIVDKDGFQRKKFIDKLEKDRKKEGR